MSKSSLVVLFFSLFLGSHSAQADAESAWDLLGDLEARAEKCANNDKDKANISAITKKVNLFGTWKGTLNEKTLVATLFKDGSGNYKGQASLDGSEYGPYSLKICTDGGVFYGVVFGYEAKFTVISKTRIKVFSPLDETETVILRKQ